MGLFESIYELAARMTETGLLAMDSSLRSMQSALSLISGQESVKPAVTPPVNGPTTLDDATADFADQLVRIARTTPLSSSDWLNAWREVAHATKRSFSGLEPKNPLEWMFLPMHLPFSLGTLLTQQALRGLYVSRILGLQRAPGFASYMAESFSDIQVFLSLQYKELLARFREEVRRAPDDAKAHLRLGQMLIKTGLFREAAKELGCAANDLSVRTEALSEIIVAHYRAGDFRAAIRDGSTSLALASDNNRTRFWVWQAAQHLCLYR